MRYRQLTSEQRYQIAACLGIGMKRSAIAGELHVHRSTVSREIARNGSGGGRGYRPTRAIGLTRERHRRKRKHRIGAGTFRIVERLLALQWSPEQIANRLRMEGGPSVSHETIYQHVYRDKLRGGRLHLHLRRRRKYRVRQHKYDRRGLWDGRRPIAERPKVVDERLRLGDWEADTIIGGGLRQAILSLVERRSRYCVLAKVDRKSAAAVARALTNNLLPVRDQVLTITSDNGREFRRHDEIARTLQADYFFADPYSSWQRGTVENTNGLVRQYFPKGSNFAILSHEDVRRVTDRLNDRPRRSLNFKTPYEVFFNRSVALIT